MTDIIRQKLGLMRQEGSLSDFIGISSIIAPGTIMGRNGELVASYSAKGIAFETEDQFSIEDAVRNTNTLFRAIARNDVAVQIHRLRRPMCDELTACAQDGFARDLSLGYNQKIGHERLVATELYISLIMKKRNKLNTKHLKNLDSIRHEQEVRLEEFSKIADQFERTLSRFDVRRLGEYELNGQLYSEQLSLYNFLLTGKMQRVQIPNGPLYETLGAVQLFIGSDVLELQTAQGCEFAQCIELKDFTQSTFSGILDNILYPDKARVLPYVFIETQTFAFMSKIEGQKFLQIQQKQLISSEDAGVSQIQAMSAAIDGVVNGDFAMGEYSYTLMVFASDLATVKQNAQDAIKKLQDEGFLPFVSTLALGAAYFSQLPCAFEYRPRLARITSLNFSHLAPLHNFACGKRDGNPWGEALALLKTPSDQPYYFNFHTSPAGEDSFNKKTLANTTIIGTSGSGKTVLLNFLISMAQKYRNDGSPMTVVFFDKDRGAEIAIRALDGGYLTVQNGQPTGFNPFALPATEGNIQFLISFMKLLLSMDKHPISSSEDHALSEAVRAVMQMPQHIRRMYLVPQNLPEGLTRQERENSLTKRLQRWINGGDLAWVFDNAEDKLDFNKYPNFGIDGTEFLDNSQVRTPIAYYLLHRMDEVIDGRRFFFVMDEFWKWLLDEAFSDFAFNKLKTIRKQNGFGVFATQSPSDVITSPIAKAVIEQSATQIFLPNPRADKDDYVKGFKVTEAEYKIISEMGEDSRLMLVKQGHRSVLCRLDLSDFRQELKVLSGSTDNILLVEQLRHEHGDNAANWLPLFLGGLAH